MNPHLEPNSVHIWRINLDRPTIPLERCAQFLATDEQQRAARFRFEKDRLRFTIARGSLRQILAQYLSLSPERVEFAYGERGKPAVVNDFAAGELCFNVSHSQDLALVAIALNRRIGVDLEYLRPIDAVALAQRFFSPSEAAIISALEGADQQRCFFRGWTQKEAFLKATGDGLIGLESVETRLALDEPMGLIKVDGKTEAATHWVVQELEIAVDYIAALVVEGPAVTMTNLSG